MHAHHLVEVELGHVGDRRVAQDPGVVDQDVELAERLDRQLDDGAGAVPTGDVVVAAHRLAATRPDLGGDVGTRRGVVAGAVAGDAAVVDDDGDTVFGEQQRMLAAEPPPGAGHDRDAPLEFNHDAPQGTATSTAR